VRRVGTIWDDLGGVAKGVWLSLVVFAGLFVGAATMMKVLGACPQANRLDLLAYAFHVPVIAHLAQTDKDTLPDFLTFPLPLLTTLTQGEEALRVMSPLSQSKSIRSRGVHVTCKVRGQ